MFWAIEAGRVDTDGLRIEGVPADIETLNGWALEGRLEVTALSVGAYPFVQDRYALLPHGASLGDGYGPVVVAREAREPASLAGRRIAVPGPMTTAFLVARLALPAFEPVHLPFDAIMEAVTSGAVEAGVVIHEGQLTYAEHGLERVLDLGAWWLSETGLPLPLGANAVRRNLGDDVAERLSRVLRASIEAASTIARRRSAMPSASGAASPRAPATSSWPCTSTSGRATTGPKAARRGGAAPSRCGDRRVRSPGGPHLRPVVPRSRTRAALLGGAAASVAGAASVVGTWRRSRPRRAGRVTVPGLTARGRGAAGRPRRPARAGRHGDGRGGGPGLPAGPGPAVADGGHPARRPRAPGGARRAGRPRARPLRPHAGARGRRRT
jgi:predicted solute-binding protein